MTGLFDICPALIEATRAGLALPGREFKMKLRHLYYFESNVSISVSVTMATANVFRLEVLMTRSMTISNTVTVYTFMTSADTIETLYAKANEDIQTHRLCQTCNTRTVKQPVEFCTWCIPTRFLTSPDSEGQCMLCLEALRGCLVRFPNCAHLAHARCVANRRIPCPLRCSDQPITLQQGDSDASDDDDDE